MNDTYQQLLKLVDNCLSFRKEDNKMAVLERDIILEKIRELYVSVSQIEIEEYKAEQGIKTLPEQETKREETEQKVQQERQFSPPKTLDEDIDLFFDTEHESYDENNNVQEELDEIAAELEKESPVSAEPVAPEKQEPAKAEQKAVEENVDIFQNLEEDTQIVVEEEIHDDLQELFPEEQLEVKANAEDDILKFAQQKKSAPKVEQRQQRSLNDLFNEHREDNSISGQYQRAKVGDLTKAISINDKFIYIKELFHNKGEDFSSAIKTLNECKNINDAFDCLENLKQKYYWDSTSEAYLSFCDLLRRKYS